MNANSELKSKYKGSSSVINPAPRGHTSARVMGAFILIIELGLLFVYGFEGKISNEYTSWGNKVSPQLLVTYQGYLFYWMTLIFTIIGFGCLYAANAKTTLSGFFISFFIVGFTTIFSPVVQKFWFNVFTSSFRSDQIISTLQSQSNLDFIHYNSGNDVMISFYSMRISLLNAISQLVVFYGLYQKLNIAQVFFLSIFYQFVWALNYYLNVQMSKYQPDNGSNRFFDDYAINQVFLFASVFGLIVCLLTKQPPKDDLRFGKLASGDIRLPNELPLITSLIGTFLLYITFMGITVLFPVKTARNRFFAPQTFMNIMFALSACVFTNMFLSSVIRNKLGIRQIHFGMIGGAIMAGPIAGTLSNFGVMMAIGTFAGIVSALYFGIIHNKINKNNVFDTYGILYIFLVSLIGTMVVAPLVLLGMQKNLVTSNQLDMSIVSNQESAGWALVYVGISAGVALISGLIIGLFLRCFERQILKQFDDQNIFITLPGLNDKAYIQQRSKIKDSGNNYTGAHLNAQNQV